MFISKREGWWDDILKMIKRKKGGYYHKDIITHRSSQSSIVIIIISLFRSRSLNYYLKVNENNYHIIVLFILYIQRGEATHD